MERRLKRGRIEIDVVVTVKKRHIQYRAEAGQKQSGIHRQVSLPSLVPSIQFRSKERNQRDQAKDMGYDQAQSRKRHGEDSQPAVRGARTCDIPREQERAEKDRKQSVRTCFSCVAEEAGAARQQEGNSSIGEIRFAQNVKEKQNSCCVKSDNRRKPKSKRTRSEGSHREVSQNVESRRVQIPARTELDEASK